MCHDEQPLPGGGPKFQACRVCETTSNSKGHPKCRHVPPRWASAFSFWSPQLPPGNFGRIDYLCEPHGLSAATTHRKLHTTWRVKKRPAAEIWPPEPKCVG